MGNILRGEVELSRGIEIGGEGGIIKFSLFHKRRGHLVDSVPVEER